MKTTAATLTAILSCAAAQTVTLITESQDPALAGKEIYSVHEGAAINGVYVATDAGATGDSFIYNASNNGVYELWGTKGNQFSAYLAPIGNTLTVTPTTPNIAKVVNRTYVTVNGSASSFYACKPLPQTALDPYHRSTDSWGVAIIGPGLEIPGSCKPIKIKVQDSGTGTPSKTTTQSHPVTTPPSHNKTTSQHRNSTATAPDRTVITTQTSYTTIYCPSPTTIAYDGKTYTVTSATTLTVKDCGCSESPSPVAPGPAKPTGSSGGSNGGSNGPTPVNGGTLPAANLGVGLAAIAAAIALI